MIRDMQGDILQAGKTIRTKEETFLGISSLPNWLTVTGRGATSSIAGLETDYGYLQINTGSDVSDVTVLNIFPNGVIFDNIKEIILSLDSLVFSSASIIFFMSIMNVGATKGVTIEDRAVNTAIVGRNVSKVTIPTNYKMLGSSEFQRRRNISLRLRSNGTVALLEGDNVFAEKTFTTAEMDLNGVLFPQIAIQTDVAVSNYLRLSRIALTIIHN